MNYLIPLMVVIPILAALIVNIFGGKDKTVKAISIVVAIAIPIIAIIAAVGIQYFGGHDPALLASSLPSNLVGTLVASYNTGIVYVFENIERIFIFLMGIVAFLAVLTYFSEKKEVSGPYLYLIFMGIASVTALMLSNDIFNMYVFFEITALTQVGIIIASSTEDNYEIALKYLILGAIGGPMLLLGIGFISPKAAMLCTRPHLYRMMAHFHLSGTADLKNYSPMPPRWVSSAAPKPWLRAMPCWSE